MRLEHDEGHEGHEQLDEAERHVRSVMRYRVRGGSAGRKRAGASRCASASIRPFAMFLLFWIGRPTVQLGNQPCNNNNNSIRF